MNACFLESGENKVLQPIKKEGLGGGEKKESGETHQNFRRFKNSPVARLLSPFWSIVITVNHYCDKLILALQSF